MNWLNDMTEPSTFVADRMRIYGVVIGSVTNNRDPQQIGRVKLKFPWLSDSEETNWVRIAVPMAGNDRGFFFLPEIGDEVLVAFEQGDPNYPYVIGALWNGADKPPEKNEDGKNNIRLIKSRSGHIVRFNDEPGKESIDIIDKSGNNQITFNTAQNTITIESSQDIELSAPKGAIKLKANEIQLEATSKLDAKSQAEMNLQTNGVCNVKGSIINLN